MMYESGSLSEGEKERQREVERRFHGPQIQKVNGISGRVAQLEQQHTSQFIRCRLYFVAVCVYANYLLEPPTPLFLSVFSVRHLSPTRRLQGGGGAGCCGRMLAAVDKTRGDGDRKGARGFRVNGLIDWSSPVHLLCLSISPVESTEHSE